MLGALAAALLQATALACLSAASQGGLPAAIHGIEAGLPPAPEVAGTSDAKTVLEALAGESVSDAELFHAAGRVYGEPVHAEADGTALAAWASHAASDVHAYGLFVRDDGGRLVAAGSYWLSPLVERLRVVRMDRGTGARLPDELLLDAVGSCLVQVRDWIEVPIRVLDDLLEATPDVQVYLVADGDSGDTVQRHWIAADELLAAATFAHPTTADLTAFSAWFVGAGPGPVALGRALPRVRSSLGPRDLWTLIRGIR